MVYIKTIAGDEFISEEEIGLITESIISFNAEKIHRVFYRYTDMSEEEKKQAGIPEGQIANTKVIEYGFIPMTADPSAFIGKFNLIVNSIVCFGNLNENAGMAAMFKKYKEVN